MRTSSGMTTSAVLRTILGIKDAEMAELLGCSRHTIHSLESGRLKLSDELATKMFHETGISVDWLLKGDPSAPAIAANREPYSRETFEKTQANKKWFDRQHPWFRSNDALGFCAQLVAILESANARKNYFMAAYKVGAALESLRKQFGQDTEKYRSTDARVVYTTEAVRLLRPLVAHGEKVSKFKPWQKKRSSSRRRVRPV